VATVAAAWTPLLSGAMAVPHPSSPHPASHAQLAAAACGVPGRQVPWPAQSASGAVPAASSRGAGHTKLALQETLKQTALAVGRE